MTRPEIVAWIEEDGARIYKFPRSGLSPDRDVRAGLLAAHEAWSADGHPPASFVAANDDDGDDAWVAALAEAGFAEVFAQVEMKLRLDVHSAGLSRFALAVPCEPDHLKELWELNNVVYAGREFTGLATDEGLRSFIADAQDLGFWAMVVDEDGYAKAFVGAHINEHGVGWIDELSVHPGWRRRGIGRGLLVHVLAVMLERDTADVHLFTDRDNAGGARSLYEDVGFQQMREMRRFRLPLV